MAGNNFLDKLKNNIDNSLLSASKLKPGDLKSQTPSSFTFPVAKKNSAFTVEKTNFTRADEKKVIIKPVPPPVVENVSSEAFVSPVIVSISNPPVIVSESNDVVITVDNTPPPAPIKALEEKVIPVIKQKEIVTEIIVEPVLTSDSIKPAIEVNTAEPQTNIVESKIKKTERFTSLTLNYPYNYKFLEDSKKESTISFGTISPLPFAESRIEEKSKSLNSHNDITQLPSILEPVYLNEKDETIDIQPNVVANVPEDKIEPLIERETIPTPVVIEKIQAIKEPPVPILNTEEEAFKKWIATVDKTPEEVQAELEYYRRTILREEKLAQGLVEVYDISSRTSVFTASKEEQIRQEISLAEVPVENVVEEEIKSKSQPPSLLSIISPTEKEVFFKEDTSAPVALEKIPPSISILKPVPHSTTEEQVERIRVASNTRALEIENRKKDRQMVGRLGPEDFFIDEIKVPEVLDLFEKIKSKEQSKLNDIIIKERRITLFRAMCYSGANHISLMLEALEQETHSVQETKSKRIKVKITAEHLRKMGFEVNSTQEWEEEEEGDIEDFEEEFDPENISRLHERNSSMGTITQDFSYLNPIGSKIAQKRQELDISDKKKKREDKILKHRKTLDIYTDNEASIYQKAIAQFLAENEDILKDKSDHSSVPHAREKDEFEEFLEELDDD